MTQTQDLLVALEKDLSVPGSFRNEQVRWIMAHGWLIGDRVSDLYVIDGEVLFSVGLAGETKGIATAALVAAESSRFPRPDSQMR